MLQYWYFKPTVSVSESTNYYRSKGNIIVFFPLRDIWFHITLSWSWSYGLQCALHHLSTWFLKWNLSTTIVIVDILCAVVVNLLLTGLHPYFLRWHASSYIIVSENKNNQKNQKVVTTEFIFWKGNYAKILFTLNQFVII